MYPAQALSGPGYSVQLPPGFTVMNGVPAMGAYWLLPPNSIGPQFPAIVQIRSVPPYEIQMLVQNLYSMENPWVAQRNAANLGLSSVTQVYPTRPIQMPQGVAHTREFDAFTIFGIPVRVMAVVLQGAQAAVEVIVMMNLYRWVEFARPSFELVGNIWLQGSPPPNLQLQAVVDPNRTDQVQYQFLKLDQTAIPFSSLPTQVGAQIIIQHAEIIQAGNINGTGIVLGSRNITTATSEVKQA
ncbi:MAG TPA: hypothetical protein VG860_18130 [Terriglobia bacterium]|jgi:hypothetical protein|nr:hypothetical protein [Terriglobia bacterium]